MRRLDDEPGLHLHPPHQEKGCQVRKLNIPKGWGIVDQGDTYEPGDKWLADSSFVSPFYYTMLVLPNKVAIRRIAKLKTITHPLPQGDGPDIAKLVREDIGRFPHLDFPSIHSPSYTQAIKVVFELRQAIWEREGK